MSIRRARLLKILILLLLIACPLLYWQRWAILGATFTFTLASILCFSLAVFLALFLPWKKRWLRRLCRVLRWLCVLAALAVVISFAALQNAISHTAAEAQATPPTADCLLVLGAGLYGDIPSAVLQNRLMAALQYLREHPESQAVLSGGQGPGETITEALAMQRWLLNNGIEEERLHVEDKSTSTGENIAFSLPIIRKLGYEQAIIVSNDFHLLRASWLAAHYGLSAQLLGAPVPQYHFEPATYRTREYFALVKDWLLLTFFPNKLP